MGLPKILDALILASKQIKRGDGNDQASGQNRRRPVRVLDRGRRAPQRRAVSLPRRRDHLPKGCECRDSKQRHRADRGDLLKSARRRQKLRNRQWAISEKVDGKGQRGQGQKQEYEPGIAVLDRRPQIAGRLVLAHDPLLSIFERLMGRSPTENIAATASPAAAPSKVVL